ncbi:Predicted N-formylglutamate amidohydrolase [Sphingomonas guangdongensis]|uniref:Predicted N-formylglutamate amidohydrolase n=1 Tax=Sphingomonas guangdongensis TaxID=1141890 RepID=A0A285R091_9SPHN|nr:N-formylglutamate amidohydrolase [Sphingomonas guangdongensis]SOB87511.1 Predicted N-formylglutamate amidohydrolase [Sphingomonas guangdongensis]
MSARVLDGSGDVLLLCDHASAAVPDDIALGVAPTVMAKHVALDIGAEALTLALAARLDVRAALGTVSRLDIDLHREPDHPQLIPVVSDGYEVPGNHAADRAERIRRFHSPYHRAVHDLVRVRRPALIVAVHSFTPRLEVGRAADRRWDMGVLSNRDRRAADLAIAFLAQENLVVGDNEPYSGRLLNATLNRHAEARGIPSLSLEVRNDHLLSAPGVATMCDIVARCVAHVRDGLARGRHSAT